jgi:hypothetical protein
MAKRYSYVMGILIALDQLGNALFYGDPDETISSRLGKKKLTGKEKWWHRLVSKALNRIDPRHVEEAIEHDRGADIRGRIRED